MAESRTRTEWARTSELMALIANLARGGKGRHLTAEDFSPFRAKGQDKSEAPKAKQASEFQRFKRFMRMRHMSWREDEVPPWDRVQQ